MVLFNFYMFTFISVTVLSAWIHTSIHVFMRTHTHTHTQEIPRTKFGFLVLGKTICPLQLLKNKRNSNFSPEIFPAAAPENSYFPARPEAKGREGTRFSLRFITPLSSAPRIAQPLLSSFEVAHVSRCPIQSLLLVRGQLLIHPRGSPC